VFDFSFFVFADEVRALGRLLNIPAPLVQRHPFPGPGLAIRILGPVSREQVKVLQQADNIYIEEIKKAGLYNQISQAFAVLLPVRAVGVMGDKRTYEQASTLISQDRSCLEDIPDRVSRLGYRITCSSIRRFHDR